MPRSAGHLIVSTLENAGIKRAYAVPGESYLDVLDGLYDSAIETIVCRQEGGAGFMALAESRLTGRPGIAMVTRGPGAANAMISIHTAWQDGTALVLFVGLVPTADRARESFQEFSLPEWFSSTAKAVITIDDEHRAGELTAEALRIAASGRPGPVVVGLPEDVLVRLTDSPAPTPSAIVEPAPSAADLEALSARLRTADRPAFVLGGDGWHSGCGRELAELAASAGIPIFADWRAYDAVPHTGAAWAGWLGYGRADAIAAGFAEADLLVFVGATRSDVASDGYTIGFDAETVLVGLDPEATQHAGRIDQQILASPRSFVNALAEFAGGSAVRSAGGSGDPATARDNPDTLAPDLRAERSDEWMLARAHAQSRFSAHRPDAEAGAGSANAADSDSNPDSGSTVVSEDNPGVDLGVVFGILDDRLGGEAILTYGAGNATIWGHRFLRHLHPASLVGARNGAMGLAVPAAVAASLAAPERRAVAICGDGDFLMNGQEIATAFAHGASPLIIVIDNGVYGTIVSHQQNHYPGRPSGTRMVNPDFGTWMSAFIGGHGERVEATEHFAPALDRALAATGPALLHLTIDPETMPPAADEIPA
ncbi:MULTISPECIES: thiamine pyrophosphate-dependent enzyme [unclassified Brevibacterium]|uniref:thiamine pyrophosphate-dependent enzyme n=1 Tax=unclassified Brevibacterium TaxID=2614124 RepID=UPI001E54B8D6|nr:MULTISPECIES: thiamine pyrophosphate-dependent enzyme [unclassified Brevibacterium]MCD1286470.1 acetolactate synthase [Brevibacterium sp. CCUG 69071]MDK8433837.1 thiamine pyrophosphate-binding protein [Brevibacterium sp. H-BE7]